jgi:hypothetical protein
MHMKSWISLDISPSWLELAATAHRAMFLKCSRLCLRHVALSILLVLIATGTLGAQTGSAQRYRSWRPAASVDPGGRWGVNTDALEGCPIEAPDGQFLYFASNRPGGKGLLDIWVAENTFPDHAWGNAGSLPEPINSAFNDFCPTPLPGGRLLFVSNRPNSCGGGSDIWETRLHPVKGWLEPKNLGCQVNSQGNEFSPTVFELEGQLVLFFSSDRLSLHHIYTSTLGADGVWSAAQPVNELNSNFEDARPNVSADGLEIFFDSTRQGGASDIWSAIRSNPFAKWSDPFRLGPNVNTANPESRPSISRDGRTLLFGSTRSGGQGNSDIYSTTRDAAPRQFQRSSLDDDPAPAQ